MDGVDDREPEMGGRAVEGDWVGSDVGMGEMEGIGRECNRSRSPSYSVSVTLYPPPESRTQGSHFQQLMWLLLETEVHVHIESR